MNIIGKVLKTLLICVQDKYLIVNTKLRTGRTGILRELNKTVNNFGLIDSN